MESLTHVRELAMETVCVEVKILVSLGRREREAEVSHFPASSCITTYMVLRNPLRDLEKNKFGLGKDQITHAVKTLSMSNLT